MKKMLMTFGLLIGFFSSELVLAGEVAGYITALYTRKSDKLI